MAPPDRSGTFGLPRGRRLTPAGYRAVFDNQQSRATRYFVMWTRQTEETRGQLGVVAAKRSFRRAVDRNRARRLLREAYRLNKHRWYEALRNADVQCAWLVVFQGGPVLNWPETQEKITGLFDRWVKEHVRPDR